MNTTSTLDWTPIINTPPTGGVRLEEESMHIFDRMFFELWGPHVAAKSSLEETQDLLIDEYLANKSLTSSQL